MASTQAPSVGRMVHYVVGRVNNGPVLRPAIVTEAYDSVTLAKLDETGRKILDENGKTVTLQANRQDDPTWKGKVNLHVFVDGADSQITGPLHGGWVENVEYDDGDKLRGNTWRWPKQIAPKAAEAAK